MASSNRQPLSLAFLILVGVATLLPLVSFFFAALQPAGSLVAGLAWPSSPHWENFATVWTSGAFGVLFRNSLVIIVFVVPLTVGFATLAGYAIATLRFHGSQAIYLTIIAGIAMPVELIIVPIYYDFQSLGLLGGYTPIVLTEVAMFMPFGVFWMTTHFRSVPREIAEAAQVDGAAPRAVLWYVLLPGARSALITLGLLSFIWSWNQFLLVLVLIQDPERRTAPSGLGFFVGEHSIDVPSLAAASFILMTPPLLVYMFFQRHFVVGTLAGALK